MIYEAIDYWNSPDLYLEHHGVKGMKWGVRKAYHNFQGRRLRRSANKIQEDINSLKNTRNKNGMSEKDTNESVAALEKIRDKQLNKAKQHESYQPKSLTKGQKVAIGVGVAAGVLAVCGAYKLHQIRQDNKAAVGKYLSDNNIWDLGSNVHSLSSDHSSFKNGDWTKIGKITRDETTIKKGIFGPALDHYRRTTTLTSKGNTTGKIGKTMRKTVGYVGYAGGSKKHFKPYNNRYEKQDYIKIYKDIMRKNKK